MKVAAPDRDFRLAGEVMVSGKLGDNIGYSIKTNDTHRWLETDDGAIQSAVRLSSPDYAVMPVTQTLLGALALVPDPLTVLNLGAGGGALERALGIVRPKIRVTSVEHNPKMLELARKYLFFPDDAAVSVTSADAFIEQLADKFDVIYCDLFNGRSPPAFLYEDSFYRSAQRAVLENGLLAANFHFLNEADLVKALLPVRRYFPWVAVYKVEHFDNVCVFAANSDPGAWDSVSVRFEQLGDTFRTDFSHLVKHLEILPKRVICQEESHS